MRPMSFFKKLLQIFRPSMQVPKKSYKTVLPDARDLDPEFLEQSANQGNTTDMPISDMLDLHHFSPKDLKFLLPEYLEECRKAGILEIRVVHGKGKGVLKKTTHSILERIDFVESFKLADERSGSWGATWVRLKP